MMRGILPDTPRNILLVRLSARGDIVFASPLVRAFRRTNHGFQPLKAQPQAFRGIISVPRGTRRTGVEPGYPIQVVEGLVQADALAPRLDRLLETALPVQCLAQTL